MIIIGIIVYVLIAAVAVAGLYIAANKYANACYDIWPIICGIFWPVAGPIAAAYIAAKWYMDNHQ